MRQAESTPPVGAWELIKSQIAAPYTPPFKFPVWTIVGVSAVLLGGMALTDEVSEELVIAETAVIAPIQEGQIQERTASYIAESAQEPNSAEEIADTQEIVNTGTSSEEITATKGEMSNGDDLAVESTILDKTDENSEADAKSILPIQIQTAQPLQALVEQEMLTESEVNDQNTTDFQSTVQSKLSIEGLATCYTPCQLNLSAKGNAVKYHWDAASFGLIDGENLTLIIDEPQSFTVYAMAKYADGTERSVPRTVEVKAGSELFVPNSFTPNGDGVNDSYSVSGTGIESFSMTIVNSKGKVVFQTSNINEAWKFEGSSIELDNEFYTAIVRAVGVDGKVIAKSERLTINP